MEEVLGLRSTQLQSTHYNLRNKEKLSLVYPEVESQFFGKHSLRSLAPTIWNDLPNECRKAVSLGRSKNLISTWEGIKCKCAMCNGN